jgi:exodeoxyribonuclease-3
MSKRKTQSSAMTLLSWNINGIRAAHKRGFLDWLRHVAPDVLCLQETKANDAQLDEGLARPAGYHAYWHAAQRAGYSGTALLTREEPVSITYGIGVERFDVEGRTIIADYPDFTLINCYFPSGSRDHTRVLFKLEFYEAFLTRCEELRAGGKTVIFCGDVNTAHREIDLARPKTNRKTSGFLPEERAWIDRIIAAEYVDTFRHFYPELAEQYTWWSTVTHSRAKNVGWRLDYFFIVREALERVLDAFIMPDVTGSDHCPVGIRLKRLVLPV